MKFNQTNKNQGNVINDGMSMYIKYFKMDDTEQHMYRDTIETSEYLDIKKSLYSASPLKRNGIDIVVMEIGQEFPTVRKQLDILKPRMEALEAKLKELEAKIDNAHTI